MTNQPYIPQQPVLDTPQKRELHQLVMETFGKNGRFGYFFLFLGNSDLLHIQCIHYELHQRATPEQWEFLCALKERLTHYIGLYEKATDQAEAEAYWQVWNKLMTYGKAYCEGYQL